MKAPSFQFYAQDFLTGTMYLTNEEIGIYIKMLAKQWTDGKIPKKRLGFLVGVEWDNLSEELKSKFEDFGDFLINERLERERDKKEKFLEKQRNNGKKGGRPSKNQKPKENPKETQTQTQKKPLEDEDEKEYIEDNKGGVGEKEEEFLSPKEIVKKFNILCPTLPKVEKMTDSRKSHIRARQGEHGDKVILQVFEKSEASKFLTGSSEKGWRANFDWVMNPNNFLKILEGNYDNSEDNGKGKNKQSNSESIEGKTNPLDYSERF